MRHSKINYNEVVTYIGQPIIYNGKTLLNTNDIVHVERQLTARKIVVFAIKVGNGQFTIKSPRADFKTLPNRPHMKSFTSPEERNIEGLNIVNSNVRYVMGAML
tara:strand:+ start:403 stop:714 length:312 start_codon:yes stop_codon:yes gene_type:complete